ncbi:MULTISPECIES: TRIC cation channel family protein [unclassified Novosphingobium]|uniref:TRIC cation channel family protein n=1 Tax=unclassified Novosphingobium TaxID=2644732 RepID=UPI001F214B48|nr:MULTISPECIES: TRIC cation channel family protein [unclassified Novosphingobium]
MLDAAGLALFAVAGSEKALAYGLSPVMGALLGMLTGIGDGVARDVLLGGSLLHLPLIINTLAAVICSDCA